MHTLRLLDKVGNTREVTCFTPEEYEAAGVLTMPLWKKIITQRTEDRKTIGAYQIIITFDIETSTVERDGERYTFMYHWQACVGGTVIFGRTWDQWINLLNYIHNRISIDDHHKTVIFIHKLEYESTFMIRRLPVKPEDIFATDVNKPLKIALSGALTGFEFRCTYRMTNKPLATVAEDCTICPFLKDKNDLDYNTVRTASTTLTDTELGYCAKDVLIPYYYIKELLENGERNIYDIPTTSTGFVRREAKKRCRKEKEWKKFRKAVKLDPESYELYNMAFRGGDTHSNAFVNGDIVEHVKGCDIASSYPTQLLIREFPASPPEIIEDCTAEQFRVINEEGFLWVGTITISNVACTDFAYIPASKCTGLPINGTVIDNGRVVTADGLQTTITSVDFEIIKRNYHFTLNRIDKICIHARKALLPMCFRKFILDLYRDKTALKGIEGQELNYMLSKQRINGCYGMACTALIHDEVKFDPTAGEWIIERYDIHRWHERYDEYKKMINRQSNWIPYEIGVFTAAYARAQLHDVLDEIHCLDAIYWDTDSVKYIGDHEDILDRVNDRIRAIALSIYSEDQIAPKDRHGVQHLIGIFEDEYGADGVTFKTFGAKKYCTRYPDGHEQITIAGLNKKTAKEYLQQRFGSVLDLELGQIFSAKVSGRTAAEYCYTPFTLTVNGEEVHEESYMNIIPTTYTLDESEAYKAYIIRRKHELGCNDIAEFATNDETFRKVVIK